MGPRSLSDVLEESREKGSVGKATRAPKIAKKNEGREGKEMLLSQEGSISMSRSPSCRGSKARIEIREGLKGAGWKMRGFKEHMKKGRRKGGSRCMAKSRPPRSRKSAEKRRGVSTGKVAGDGGSGKEREGVGLSNAVDHFD